MVHNKTFRLSLLSPLHSLTLLQVRARPAQLAPGRAHLARALEAGGQRDAGAAVGDLAVAAGRLLVGGGLLGLGGGEGWKVKRGGERRGGKEGGLAI